MSHQPKILVLTGPNLNMLGLREPSIYGAKTLQDIEDMCEITAKELGYTLSFRQSNHEGELVTWIQEAVENFDAVVINAGAYTHTSIAIMDAIKLLDIPVIEVHISNIFAREAFRHHSYISPVATGVICGMGPEGYTLALHALEGKMDIN